MELVVKENDTLHLSCKMMNAKGMVADLADIEIAADVRTQSGLLIDSLVVSNVTSNGIFTLSSEKEMLSEGTLNVDILFTSKSTGKRKGSDTFTIKVVKSITKRKTV